MPFLAALGVAGLLAAAAAPSGAEDEGAESLESLVTKLGARRHVDRAEAGLALVARGKAAIPALAKALRDPDVVVRAVASEVLGMIGDPVAIGPLRELLVREAATVGTQPPPDLMAAREALRALARLGREGANAIRTVAEGSDPATAPLAALAADAGHEVLAEEIQPLLRGANGGGSYAGQFEGLRRFGPSAVPTLCRVALATLRAGDIHVTRSAVLALGDVAAPGTPEAAAARDALETIAAAYAGRRERAAATDQMLSDIVAAEFRLGFPDRLNQTIAELARDAGSVRTGLPDPGKRFSLAMAYLHRRDYQKSIDEFQELFRRREGDWANAGYNVACAYALWGRRREALAALRAVVTAQDGYDGEAWMCEDGDLRSIRETGEFRYILAVLKAKNVPGRLAPGDPWVPGILQALRDAAARGYRRPPAEDVAEDGVFRSLAGDPGFRAAWEALGGSPLPSGESPAPAVPPAPTTPPGGGSDPDEGMPRDGD